MSDATDRTSALTQLTELSQPTVVPTLTTTALSGEIDVILDRHKRASTWAAATAYVSNNIILPTVRTGHRYRCVIGGTSGATEPFTGSSRWPTTSGARVSDGTSSPALTWVEDGPEYSNIYDIRQAAYECWNLKATKASQFIATGDLMFQQVFDHCIRMRDSFAPMGV